MIKRTSFLTVSSRKVLKVSTQDGILFCKNSKITTCFWTTIDRRMLDPTKKRFPMSKEKPQQDVRRGEIVFRIKPHTCQRCSEGSNKNLVCTRTQEKGAVTPQEIDSDLPVSVQKSPVEAWVSGGRLQCWGHWVQQCMLGPFEGVWHYLHHLHHSLVSSQITGREHSPTHQQKVGLKIYWAWPRPSEQDPVSPTVRLSHQEASVNLLSLSVRGQTEWKPQSQKSNWSHGPQTCLTQWNYEPCYAGPPKTDGSWWRVLTKRGPLEKGMANNFSVLALRAPWTVWKGKKIWHRKMNPQQMEDVN